MNGTTSRKCHAKPKTQGFALVISLSLMVLLTVLAIGLMGLSSISLRSSTREEALVTARGYARVAMLMALGELQKQAGPDQRVTGTADLAGTSDGSRLTAGSAPGNNVPLGGSDKGLTSVQPGTRHWTGVWTNSNSANPGTTIYTRTPTPSFRKWLVSGNEKGSSGNDFTPATNGVAVDSDGRATNPEAAVVLVGRNSAGSSSSDGYVSAPLVKIMSPSSLAKHPLGRQAWWIGDEGVKAKLNMSDPEPPENELAYEDLAAPRRGWETVDGFENYPDRNGGDNLMLAKVITLPQAGVMDPSLLGGNAAPLGKAFHSATTESFGLLTDALNGGLKLDLSNYLQQGLPATAPGNLINGITANGNIVPQTVASRLRGPKWKQLADFQELGRNTKQLGRMNVKAASQITDTVIAPLVVDFRVLMGVKLVPQANGASSYKIQPCAKIAVSLANPYPYPLVWSGMDLELKCETHPSRQPARIYGVGPDSMVYPAVLPRVNAQFVPQEASVFGNTVFQIPSTTLQPGEAKAFTIGGPVNRPAGSISRTSVPMVPFGGASAANFNNCVLLESNHIGTPPFSLDIREDTITSQASLELRPSGSSAIYRRIERMEFDNAPHNATRRAFTVQDTARFTQPVPLQYYGFQLSQPGMDYASILPSADQLGLRSSTMRTFMDFNMQAANFRKPIICYNPPPYFMLIADSPGTLPFQTPGGNTGPEFTRNLAATPLPWGRSALDTRQTVLFSPPASLVSLAQFQHADLTADDDAVSVGHQPGNAVGNSYASLFVPRLNTIRSRSDFTIESFSGATGKSKNYYDIAYLLNAALWDTYFFSTLPAGTSGVPLNRSMVKIHAGDSSDLLRDGEKAASRLMVNGAHNVNSTDVDAWKALLASSRGLRHKSDSTTNEAIFPRSLEQPGGASNPPSGNEPDSFSGFRRLNDDQIHDLALEITRQVRVRGPFVSLSQFVNRSLGNITSTSARALTRSGALQSAIDESGLNISADGSKSIFPNSDFSVTEDRMNLQREGSSSRPRADLTGTRDTKLQDQGTDGQWPLKSFDENPGAVAGILADRQILTDTRYRSEQGFRSTGIPGWLTQADVLQVIGPALNVRSDTFRIRAYGEATDPETGVPTARAWCEAVVQRMPAYVDGGNSIEDRPSELNPVNARFGRRFSIVSFKWLSPDEI